MEPERQQKAAVALFGVSSGFCLLIHRSQQSAAAVELLESHLWSVFLVIPAADSRDYSSIVFQFLYRLYYIIIHGTISELNSNNE